MVSTRLTYFLERKGDIVKKSIEAFNRSPWYLQVIIGLVGLAVAVALAIPLSWLVEILWGYVLQLITIIFKWISSWMPAGSSLMEGSL